jgi:hypothetical protein
VNIVVRHWTTTTAYSVFCFGYQRRISLTNLSDGLVTALSCIVLVKLFGPVGAPIGSLAGACLVSLPFNVQVIARDTGVGVPEVVRAMLGTWVWRFALVGAAACWMAMRWSPSSLPEAALAAAVISAVYLLIMLPGVLRSPLGGYVWPLLTSFRDRYSAVQTRVS